MNQERIYRVQAQEAGQRLDLFLASKDEERSRSQFKKWIEAGRVQVNARTVKPRYLVQAGDEVLLRVPQPQGPEITPEPIPLDILYEDEHILVVNKAPGVVVHPGAGHASGTLVHGLLNHCSRLASQGSPLRPGIVHRLDRETSGVLLVAKSDPAYLRLIELFKEHRVRKRYLAWVYGRPRPEKGEIRTLIGRHPKDRKRMAVVDRNGKEAVTQWRVVTSWHDQVSLLEVRILTGRTHQIRVHCHYLGHPLLGDPTYGGGRRRARSLAHPRIRHLVLTQVQRTLLHAHRLELEHPISGIPMAWEAPEPEDFLSLRQALEAVIRHP
ncbi:ribosomal large subunit pseudouridine synthase D [Desulfacinum hydrothermale DSM 13146]|uniref:Pseudouridine synthase n=1 Tax=Desulfacinum hydrothermale DSM 13146 TaxID=1121390 RepID=A0A1W1XD93_9BACT|nr:RluA family pseudouridine synthase [Desulfacinum hydrothermale]SMC21850.1 ribosomal large subunit pseudouridine synthase D [Desulfacinum hydrothermale DSM 13146]